MLGIPIILALLKKIDDLQNNNKVYTENVYTENNIVEDDYDESFEFCIRNILM